MTRLRWMDTFTGTGTGTGTGSTGTHRINYWEVKGAPIRGWQCDSHSPLSPSGQALEQGEIQEEEEEPETHHHLL